MFVSLLVNLPLTHSYLSSGQMFGGRVLWGGVWQYARGRAAARPYGAGRFRYLSGWPVAHSV